MALILETGSITEQADGLYTVSAIVKRDTDNKVVASKTFAAGSAADLKAQLKPFFIAVVGEERKNTSMQSAAQTVMDEIMNEVTQ